MANQIALNNNILKMMIENPQSVSESDNLNQVYNQNPGMKSKIDSMIIYATLTLKIQVE